jgi:hypothetical protein
MSRAKVNFNDQPSNKDVVKLVGKKFLVLDVHGLHWDIVMPTNNIDLDRLNSSAAKQERRYDNLTEEKFWTMDLDHKVLFLQMYLQAFRTWVQWIEQTLSESTYEKEKVKLELYNKSNKWYHFLQSYRIQIETLMEEEMHRKYMGIYVYFVDEFMGLCDVVDHMTHSTFWKGVRIAWKAFVRALFS